MKWFEKSPPLGSPQNPEILEPGERPRPAPPSRLARFGILVRLVRIMIGVAIPAVCLDLICYWLFGLATSPSGYLAWVPFLFIAPPAALFTLLAVLVNFSIGVVFLLLLFGRNVQVGFLR